MVTNTEKIKFLEHQVKELYKQYDNRVAFLKSNDTFLLSLVSEIETFNKILKERDEEDGRYRLRIKGQVVVEEIIRKKGL